MSLPVLDLYIDRNTGGRSVKAVLAGETAARFHFHDDHLAPTAEDHEWLVFVSKKNYAVITGDNRTTRDPVFLGKLPAHPVHLFILLAMNGASPDGKAAIIRAAIPGIIEHIARHPRPAVWRIGKEGKFRSFDFRETLTKMARR